MAKRFSSQKLILFLWAAGLNAEAHAAAYQLWESDAVSAGNYHAGRAVTDDASTAYYNPAGLLMIQNQQVVGGGAVTLTDIHFSGTTAVNTLSDSGPQSVAAQGGTYLLTPFLHYAAPISDKVAFGLSFIEPFTLYTDYGSTSNLRYATRLNQINVYDLSPSLGIALTDKLSFGFGLDAERMVVEFDRATTAPGSTSDTLSNNSGNDHAFGYHLGALYQFSPKTRVGLSFHSQIVHQINGSSTYLGPLAPGGGISNSSFYARITLPSTTSLSAFHTLNTDWDVLGSISYTQWSSATNLTLHNVTGLQGGGLNNNLQWVIYQSYRNTWNYTLGANYHLNEDWLLRAGVGYDQTPVINSARTIALPDSDKLAMALGTHYQATTTLGFDMGWTHLFSMNARINNVVQTTGDQSVTTNGSVQQNTDVYALQVKWDIV